MYTLDFQCHRMSYNTLEGRQLKDVLLSFKCFTRLKRIILHIRYHIWRKINIT
jgi:hypothetical protein